MIYLIINKKIKTKNNYLLSNPLNSNREKIYLKGKKQIPSQMINKIKITIKKDKK